MRLLLLVCLLLSTCTLVFAQKKMQDVVYLKNGSVLRGQLVNPENVGKVSIKTIGNNLFVFDAAEVEKITLEPKRIALEPKKSGYANTTELGLFVGGSNSSPALALHTINGYTFSPYATVGIGTGIQFWWNLYQSGYWYYYTNTSKIIPLFADIRGDVLPKSRITPHYFARFGYGFATSPDEYTQAKGGILFGAGAGFKLRGSDNVGWFFGLGYQYQKNQYKNDVGGGNDLKTDLRLRRVTLQTGVSF